MGRGTRGRCSPTYSKGSRFPVSSGEGEAPAEPMGASEAEPGSAGASPSRFLPAKTRLNKAKESKR